jgi:hypothetical protein
MPGTVGTKAPLVERVRQEYKEYKAVFQLFFFSHGKPLCHALNVWKDFQVEPVTSKQTMAL